MLLLLPKLSFIFLVLPRSFVVEARVAGQDAVSAPTETKHDSIKTTTEVVDAAGLAAPMTTVPPVLEAGLELRKRADNTCGYLNGDSGYPFVCGAGGVCMIDLLSSAVGCCTVSPCPQLVTMCDDYTRTRFRSAGTGYCAYSQNPYCLGYYYKDVGRTMFQCVATPYITLDADGSRTRAYVEMFATPAATNSLKVPTSTAASLLNAGTTLMVVMPTQNSTSESISSGSGGSGGGFSTSDKIALGCGIGIGLPAALAGIWTCLYLHRRG